MSDDFKTASLRIAADLANHHARPDVLTDLVLDACADAAAAAARAIPQVDGEAENLVDAIVEEAEAQALRINAGGFGLQIPFILRSFGPDLGERLLAQALGTDVRAS